MPETVQVRYESGHVQTMDVPELGTVARDLFDDHVAKGRYTILDGDPAADVTPADPSAVPSGSVADVTVWVRGGDDDSDPVDGWQDRARQALDAEQVAPKPRKGLVALLEGLV